MSIYFTKPDNYNKKNRLNKEISNEFIKESKSKDILGEEVLLKVAYVNKLRDRARCYAKI